MKFVLSSTLLAILVFAQIKESSQSKAVCEAKNGKKLITFSDTLEQIKFPCKYNAVQDTICGSYRITVMPGNMLETNRHKLYVIRTLFVGVKRVSDGLKWEGRTDLKIARKYLEGMKDMPFNKRDGDLELENVFTFGKPNADDEVSLTEKNGEFKITFGLYDPFGKWHKNSKFSFECYSKTFEPADYPTQLCGNGTAKEVKTFKKSMEWRDNRQATIFYNVFTDMGIIQTDNDRMAAQRAMANTCVQKGEDLRYKASLMCWPLVGKSSFQRCISGNMDSAISAFRHCVEFVCSGYTDPNSCAALGDELDLCPSLPEVSDTVRSFCKPDLFST
ncbi:hypothetical protein ACOMHN_059606 [Nucella lapillus]